MIICQTLWTNKKDLTENSFGWLTPQHHLMSWALSCLKLHKYYKTIHLHTDKIGKEILIDTLGLPYTNVFNDYDHIACHEHLFALPKLLTYAKQYSPFLHVDGDVMIWRPFSNSLLSANLIAQNLEKGTEYYKKNFEQLLKELKYLPSVLKTNLELPDMYAYNAGIIGGSDISFFKNFVSLAVQLIEKNKIPNLNINFNIIFEQLLFFSLIKKEKKKVFCLKNETINDNGYRKEIFSDFINAKKLGYLHLIGPHKRDKETCDWLSRYLLQENEEVFLRITDLFKKQHFFYGKKIQQTHVPSKSAKTNYFKYPKSLEFIKSLSEKHEINSNSKLTKHVTNSENILLKELYKYEQQVKRTLTKYNKIEPAQLRILEDKSMTSTRFISIPENKRSAIVLHRNPYIEALHTAFDWTTMQISEIGTINIQSSFSKDIVIGITPELFFTGYRETVLDEVCVNIIVLTEKSIAYKELLGKMSVLFSPVKNKKEYKDFRKLMTIKIEFLIKNKILFINNGTTQ